MLVTSFSSLRFGQGYPPFGPGGSVRAYLRLKGPYWALGGSRRRAADFRAAGLTHLLAESGLAARKAGRADSGMRQRGPSRSLGGVGERQDASALSMLGCNTLVAVAR
jgi:hypothetical protein